MKINAEQYKQIIENFQVAARTRTAYQERICRLIGGDEVVLGIWTKIDALAESQGKLYAAMDEIKGSGPAWTKGFTDAQGQILKEIAVALERLSGKLDAIEKRWNESDKLMPAILNRRLSEFNTLKGRLDTIGACLAEILSYGQPTPKRSGNKRK